MRAHFGLPSVVAEEVDGRPPINVRFEIPYFTTSGIQVSFWTQQWGGGSYNVRCTGQIPGDWGDISIVNKLEQFDVRCDLE